MTEIKIVEIETFSERRYLLKSNIIMLEGEIYGARDIMEDFELLILQKKSPIKLIISSEGGDMFAGLTIIQAIRRAQAGGLRVIGEVMGSACSMSFIILQCCDERIMGKHCVCMCHGVTTTMMGDIKDVDAQQKLMQKYQGEFAELIASRSTALETEYKEVGFWHAILGENTPQFYSSDDCKVMGLIDTVN